VAAASAVLQVPDRVRQARYALRQGSLTRRAGAAAGAAALLALAIGIVIGVEGPGSSRGASTPSSSAAAATVQRRDLIATDTQSGTLSYADPQTVYNRLSGTITELPAIGTVIKAGQTLYKVDNSPVVLLNGAVPAYRDLSTSVSSGPDVRELNQNLVSLGFADGQIAVNDTWQAGTTAAVERWQASVGETQTGTVTLGQVVFLPGPQRIATVDSVLGSTGGGAASSTTGTSSGTASGASLTVAAPRTEFVSLTTGSTVPSSPTTESATKCRNSSGQNSTPPSRPGCPNPSSGSGGRPGGGRSKGGSSAKNVQLQALLALLKAETAALRSSHSSAGGSSAAPGGKGSSGSAGAGAGGGTGSGASSSSSGASGAGSAQPILGTTSTHLVVSVQLDATKQSEAVVGEPVTVQMPDGSIADGRITEVSPVAQTTSSTSSSTGGGASSSASSTIPVTIALKGRTPASGVDQAAVSINFQQQKATNVLSVPVAALLATAGGGYAVQEAQAPHRLIPVTPGLFAAGYVQISGTNIHQGLQVTDSQG
jgi:putative peptidoglycan binding protein